MNIKELFTVGFANKLFIIRNQPSKHNKTRKLRFLAREAKKKLKA